jgi:molybdopterin converting factor small subunit
VIIDVEVFGQLATNMQRRQTLTLDHPMSVHEVATMLGLNPEEVGLMTINSVQSELEDLVSTDCRLCFFPYVSGG